MRAGRVHPSQIKKGLGSNALKLASYLAEGEIMEIF